MTLTWSATPSVSCEPRSADGGETDRLPPAGHANPRWLSQWDSLFDRSGSPEVVSLARLDFRASSSTRRAGWSA